MAFHDLTQDKSAPPEAKALLGLGGKFIPTPPRTTGDISRSLQRLLRDMCIKVIFSGQEQDDHNLEKTSRLYVLSTWEPTYGELPGWVTGRMERFSDQMTPHFKCKRASDNLLTLQKRLLLLLKQHPKLLFPETDKGLGPCCVTYDQYIEDALIHLNNTEIYHRISQEEAQSAAQKIKTNINSWLSRFHNTVGKDVTTYIRQHLRTNSASPFGQFYILYKIHKGPNNGRWPTRPVCSDVSSMTHGLGKWITEMLQPIAQNQKSYFKDSFTLKDQLMNISIPPGGKLFTCDATSMYTNIRTGPAIEHISRYLRAECGKTYHHYNVDALIEAIHIVFKNNIIAFGDTFWKQISGTGMGISPAPPWATIFFGLFETELYQRWFTNLGFYRRFIDDVIGIWTPNPCPITNETLWNAFKHDMQQWHGLHWTFEDLSTSVNFMDLTISITNGRLTTTVYEKPQNLYLYLPPHSSHPRGIETGLIYGQVRRIRRLCSNKDDSDTYIKRLFQRLVARGHKPESLVPIFTRAEFDMTYPLKHKDTHLDRTNSQRQRQTDRALFFHMKYHPEDPPRRLIQHLWQQYVAKPPNETPLSQLTNNEGNPICSDRLIVAYSCHLNLRNIFSVRNINNRGKKVSHYLPQL